MVAPPMANEPAVSIGCLHGDPYGMKRRYNSHDGSTWGPSFPSQGPTTGIMTRHGYPMVLVLVLEFEFESMVSVLVLGLHPGTRFSGGVDSSFEQGYYITLELGNGQRVQGMFSPTQVRAMFPGEEVTLATVRLAAVRWNKMSDEDMKPFVEKAHADIKRYGEECERLAQRSAVAQGSLDSHIHSPTNHLTKPSQGRPSQASLDSHSHPVATPDEMRHGQAVANHIDEPRPSLSYPVQPSIEHSPQYSRSGPQQLLHSPRAHLPPLPSSHPAAAALNAAHARFLEAAKAASSPLSPPPHMIGIPGMIPVPNVSPHTRYGGFLEPRANRSADEATENGYNSPSRQLYFSPRNASHHTHTVSHHTPPQYREANSAKPLPVVPHRLALEGEALDATNMHPDCNDDDFLSQILSEVGPGLDDLDAQQGGGVEGNFANDMEIDMEGSAPPLNLLGKEVPNRSPSTPLGSQKSRGGGDGYMAYGSKGENPSFGVDGAPSSSSMGQGQDQKRQTCQVYAFDDELMGPKSYQVPFFVD
eukprot:gene15094-21148_t